jgi:1-phosphofructokinase
MILTVTLNPAVDYTVQLDEFPQSGEIARIDAAEVHAGGKGINVSKYLQQLGTETLATGLVGGTFGQFVEEELDEIGLPNDFVDIGGQTRLNTTILTPDGEYKINQHGPFVDVGVVDDVVATIECYDPETVVVAGSSPASIEPHHIDRIARAGSWETAVDLDGPTLGQLEAEYALCKPNADELAAATGIPTGTIEEGLTAAQALQDARFERVVASLGEQGAILASSDAALHAPAIDVDVVDTVGAGDSLLAGVLSVLNRGVPDAVALQSGVAVASRVVSVPGTDVPTLDDIQSDINRVQVSTR